MMVAGGMAYAAGRNRAPQEEGLQDEAAYDEPPPPAPPPSAPSADDAAGELERLSSLHQSGALSDEEFAAAKQKVLGA
ncbi:MAG: SHOCT domain-containing protein [Acidimicrobiales bacterium]